MRQRTRRPNAAVELESPIRITGFDQQVHELLRVQRLLTKSMPLGPVMPRRGSCARHSGEHVFHRLRLLRLRMLEHADQGLRAFRLRRADQRLDLEWCEHHVGNDGTMAG